MSTYLVDRDGLLAEIPDCTLPAGAVVRVATLRTPARLDANREWYLVNAWTAKVSRSLKCAQAAALNPPPGAEEVAPGEFFIAS